MATLRADSNLWVGLVFLGFMALRLIARVAGKAGREKENPPQTRPTSTNIPPPLPRAAGPISDNERVRKFLEALGQPPGSAPPPPVIPRTDIPPRPVAPVQPPRAVMVPGEGARRRTGGASRRPEQSAKPGAASSSPATARVFTERARASEPSRPLPPESSTEAYLLPPEAGQASAGESPGISSLLRSGGGLRAAMILREVFGPPRSLRPLEAERVGSA
jgi:hypothetical protein